MVQPPALRASSRIGMVLVVLGIVFILLAPVGVVATVIIPKRYSSNVVMEVERLPGSASPTLNTPKAPMHLGFLETETKVITSKETLGKVIKTLQLVKRWNLLGPENAHQKLAAMTEVTEEPGTDLIRITVYSTDLKEAAELANGIAQAYAERRTSLEAEERARLGLVTPKTPITVHEWATEATNPSRPNTKLQLALSFLSGIIGLVAVAVGAAMRRRVGSF